jgi:hypothetical protein
MMTVNIALYIIGMAYRRLASDQLPATLPVAAALFYPEVRSSLQIKYTATRLQAANTFLNW